MDSIINWLEQHLGTCFFHKFFGIQCPGCGFQRAFIELIRGNFMESIRLYPALVPIITMFVILVIHLKFKLKNGALILKVIFIFTAGIIIANYIYKVINHKIY